MKKSTVALLFLLLIARGAAGSEWYEDYERAKGKVKKGDCAEAEKLLLEALRKNPKPDNKARPYGTITLEYIPHYYLAQCAFDRGEMKKAAEYIKTAETHGIRESTKAKEFEDLKQQVTVESKTIASGLVVVVSSQNRTSGLTTAELRDLYLGNKSQWSDSTPVTPVLLSRGSKINEMFLTRICGMNEPDFATYWEGRVTQGGTMPIWIEQDDWLVRYIDRNPGAVGFMDPEKTGPLRVVSIDGKKLGTTGYILSAE